MRVSVELVHLAATLFMAGVIVFVQVVHYPLMARVGAAEFVGYQRQHTLRTGWVVGPPMLVELATAVWLTVDMAGAPRAGLAYVGLGLLAVIWASTAVFQAPAHGRLVHGFDAAVHRDLVRINWVRTMAWIARVPVAVALV